MNEIYSEIDSQKRGYYGLSINEIEFKNHLANIRDVLLDLEEREVQTKELRELKAKIEESGFTANEQLLIDIQALNSDEVSVDSFRMGEAYAEVILKEHFSCRFYWNELRDTRNPKGNKPGADLVGFIEIDGDVLFLFGEVKTSSEERYPPQVMRDDNGMEKQLKDLYEDPEKRRFLISYLSNKVRFFPHSHPFRQDLEAGLLNYYSVDEKYQLVGVLIRDIEPDERDLKNSYIRLNEAIQSHIGLKLVALYIPIKKEKWLESINSGDKND